MTALPYEAASFDGVVAAGLFPNLNDASEALGEFLRVLRRRGRLVVVEVDRSTMSSAMRTFFRVMILGYRVVSVFAPRFRFAERWNIATSTIDPRMLIDTAREAGFRESASERHASYLLLQFERGAR